MYTMHLIEASTCKLLSFSWFYTKIMKYGRKKYKEIHFFLTSSIDLLHFTLDRSHFVSLKIEEYMYTSP